MKSGMTSKFALFALAPAVLATALSGCVSQQEIMHHNDLMDETVERSMTACRQEEKDLRLALKETSTDTLEKINAASASVCLDPRLSTLRHAFMESVPYAGYYNDGRNPVITLKISTDPYKRPGQVFAPETNAKALYLLFREKDFSEPGVKFAEKHPDACGKQACDTVVWRSADAFKNVIRENPAAHLSTTPILK